MWEKYGKLTEIEHCLARPGRYIGSISPTKMNTWFINDKDEVESGELTVVPAFHKLFDEIISNSADHSRTPEGKNLTTIDVFVDPLTGHITVKDNGGIPIVMHPEYKQWIPDMIFGELRSGSNFADDADSLAAGQNGEGASLTNIFSKIFIVKTQLNKKTYEMIYTENMTKRSEPIIADTLWESGSTSIEYLVDFPRLNMKEIGLDDLILLKRRTNEVAFTNPHLQVTFNGELIRWKGFEHFVKSADPKATFQTTDRWFVGVGFSPDGFKHTSYVNSTPSPDGGTHIDHVTDKIVDIIRDKIKSKTKQNVRPSDIRNNIHLYLDCKINNPRYNSQTKEKLITNVSDFGSKFELSPKFVKDMLASKMFADILEWANRKKDLEDAKEIEDAAKSVKRAGFYDIPKYRPATNRDRSECILFLTEGDSALKPLLAASNPRQHGIFPLRGKPKNCFENSVRDVLTQEIIYVMTILNLSLSNPDYGAMRYSKVVISTDADVDGIHIRGLLLLLFKKFWPKLLELGLVQFLETPSRVVTYKGKEYDFRGESEYNDFVADKPSAKTKYCKGLGSHNSAKFATFLDDPSCYVTVDYDSVRDDDLLNMAFDPDRADDRKDWVAIV